MVAKSEAFMKAILGLEYINMMLSILNQTPEQKQPRNMQFILNVKIVITFQKT